MAQKNKTSISVANNYNDPLLRAIFDATPIGLGVISRDLMSKINNAFCKMVGYSEQEIIGKEPIFLFPTESEFRRVQSELITQMRSKGVGMTESLHKRKDGRIIDVIVGISPLDMNNVMAGQTIAVVDITEQKETEKEKAKLEEMLLHSQKLQSIGRLAGGVAHDFNNVLMVISGTAEMIMAQLTPSSTIYSELEVIQNAANSAANLTRQLLAFSRKQMLKPEVFNLNDSLNNIRKIITPIIGENIRLDIIADDNLQTIRADPGQIEQVILNLTVNARDAMACGGRLTIETKNVYLDEAYSKTHLDVFPGSYVMLSVSDTGTGMSREVVEHCFEPFFTTKESGRGTGLGLATVYGIVSQNGGVIDVFSEVGKGTVLKLYFPVSRKEGDIAKSSGLFSYLSSGNETILIAEEDINVLKIIVQTLKKAGYNVLASTSGEESLAMAQKHREQIHLFITAVILPRMNGKETSEKLALTHPETKILYSSGDVAEVINADEIFERHADFIDKPFTSKQLLEKIRAILDRP